MLKLAIEEVGAIVPPPAPTFNRPVEIWRDQTGAIYAYGEVRGEDCWMHVPGLASFRFSANANEVAASVSTGVSEDTLVDTYRRRVLPMALQVAGREVLHASAVLTPAGVIGLCGASQAGKSTIAFGLGQRGYSVWSDDTFAFELDGGRARSLAVPFEIRLRPAAAMFFGSESIRDSTNDGEPLSGGDRAPIAALCMLHRTEDQTHPALKQRLSFGDGFPRILSHACWFALTDAGDKRRVVAHYMELAAQTPTYEVSFKSGLENLPHVLDVIEEVIKENSLRA